MKNIIVILILISAIVLIKQHFFCKKEQQNYPISAAKVVECVEQPYTEYYKNGSKAVVKHFDTVYYTQQGKEIARFNSETKTGKQITFYKDSLSDNYTGIKLIQQYKKGIITHQKFYSVNEELISEGNYKEGKPFQGTFYTKHCNIYTIEEYKAGQKQKETTFNKNNKLLGTISYREGKPFSGTQYDCSQIQNYKNGFLHGKSISYQDEFYLQPERIENYRQGKLSGEYLVYNDNNLLTKLNYSNDRLKGIQLFYNNEKGYYYEINVNDNESITTIRKFSKYTNNLIKSYKVKLTTEDEFSFLTEPSSIEIIEEDVNQDGYIDIVIKNYFYRKQFSSYYLYDTLMEQLVYISEFTDAQDLKVSGKNEVVVFDSNNSEGGDIIVYKKTTYNTSDIYNLEKIKILENVYFTNEDTIVTTQLYPIDYKKYPLLDESLPPILLKQKSKQTIIDQEYQEITLEKGLPFTITFTGDASKKHYPSLFSIKVHVTLNEKNLEEVYEGVFEKHIPFFSPGNSMAVSKIAFAIDDNSNNIWVYDKASEYNNIQKKHLIKDSLYTFSYVVDTIPNYNENNSEIDFLRNNASNKPMYAVIFIDKNRNKRLETNEFFKVKFNFE